MNFINIKKDLLASIVVFLVALPLCIGISVATGLPASAGIISGIIGGIVVGFLSGSPLQVSGPAAGLIMIIVEIIQDHGLENLGIIILAAGLIQVLLGILALGKWFRAISPAIIQGMLSGIGISILFSQLHVMLDHSPQKSLIKNILTLPDTILKGIFPLDGSTHHLAAFIGIITIAAIILSKYLPSKLKTIPPTLIAVIIAIVISALFQIPIKYIDISNNLLKDINIISISGFKHLLSFEFIIAAVSVAFIASAETLLTATAVDKMSNTKTNYNKEIFAQGVGNSLAGILGVLPITGVIVRSAANVQAGAKTNMSAVFHGIWILLFITCLPFLLKLIPTASLAAILVYTGYKLINFEMAKKIYNFSKGEFLVFAITVIGIISTNLLEGILIGFGVALAKNLYKAMKLNVSVENIQDKNKIIIKIKGNLTFLRLIWYPESGHLASQ